MTLRSLVSNPLVHDSSGVWRLESHHAFGYSDGIDSERYLLRVLAGARDLGSRSAELESHIRDWRSEYHLSTKRAQLLSGFSFDRSLRALEVGCGCGAITRYLGETFDEVVAVEGSMNRARIARARTRDLSSVSILCAPFQDVRFVHKFDIIFCIGVLEYSSSFVDAPDPYDAVLQYLSELLSPDGVLVLAIENQFGLKYFCGAAEDHLGIPFAGLEGYHRRAARVRTFGKVELDTRLRRHFQDTRFYYPYPDYKIPDVVVNSAFLGSGRATELISQTRSRDYTGRDRSLWSESATVFELSRNASLDFFANSFLVIASRGGGLSVSFPQQAVFFSANRRPPFRTVTRVVASGDGQLTVHKTAIDGGVAVEQDGLRLSASTSEWIDAHSLQTTLLLAAQRGGQDLDQVFSICQPWLALLRGDASRDGDAWTLSGAHVDSTWRNAYVADGRCRIVDREWTWREPIALNVVVIRSIHAFLSSLDSSTTRLRELRVRSGRRQIANIAAALGVKLSAKDFSEFIQIESRLQNLAAGHDRRSQMIGLRWFLIDRPSHGAYLRQRQRLRHVWQGIASRLARTLMR